MLDLSPRRLQQLARIIPKDVRGRYNMASAVRGYSRYLQDQPARDGEDPDLLQAKATVEILKAQERLIRLQQLRKSLINRAQATALVHHLASKARGSWATWQSRVAALMAADLDHLDELAEVQPEFR